MKRILLLLSLGLMNCNHRRLSLNQITCKQCRIAASVHFSAIHYSDALSIHTAHPELVFYKRIQGWCGYSEPFWKCRNQLSVQPSVSRIPTRSIWLSIEIVGNYQRDYVNFLKSGIINIESKDYSYNKAFALLVMEQLPNEVLESIPKEMIWYEPASIILQLTTDE